MTVRDLAEEDVQGFLKAHAQRAEESRFSQAEKDWGVCSPLEDAAVLAVVFLCCMAAPVAFVLWKVLA